MSTRPFPVRLCTVTITGLLALAQASMVAAAPAISENDFLIENFRFGSGESLQQLRMHYATMGTPRRNARGEIDNAVLALHGTNGSGKSLLRPIFVDELFGAGEVLDAERYFIVFVDNIGHGGSSKPSDGLRTRFPEYDYDDMVRAQHELITRGLGIARLKLIIGTSMGCMHAYVWGTTYPEAAEALVPLACLPVEIAGRNRMWRKSIIDTIERDPDWRGGRYRQQPQRALASAAELLVMAGASPLELQQRCATRAAADQCLKEASERSRATLDANDLLYAIRSSRHYNPQPHLDRIRARILHINFADDFINPPELGIAERELARIPNAQFVLVPASTESRGHGTHTLAKAWKQHLVEWLAAR